jgi:hypothetical protein
LNSIFLEDLSGKLMFPEISLFFDRYVPQGYQTSTFFASKLSCVKSNGGWVWESQCANPTPKQQSRCREFRAETPLWWENFNSQILEKIFSVGITINRGHTLQIPFLLYFITLSSWTLLLVSIFLHFGFRRKLEVRREGIWLRDPTFFRKAWRLGLKTCITIWFLLFFDYCCDWGWFYHWCYQYVGNLTTFSTTIG